MVFDKDQLNQERLLNHCALKQLVTDSPVPEEVVELAICIRGHEKSLSDQFPGVLDKMEQLLGLMNMP